jgi:hypothetical protein
MRETFQAAAAAQQRLTCALRKGRRTSSLWTELEQKLISIDARSDARDFHEVERGWRFWLWPGPRWYAALALVWLIMLAGGVAVSDRGSDGRRVTVGVTAPTEHAMEEQRRLLTELLGDRALSATDEAKPRSPFRGDLTPGAKAVPHGRDRTPKREAFAGAPLFCQVMLGAPKPGEGGECASPLAFFPAGDSYLALASSVERHLTPLQEGLGRLRSFGCRRCDMKTITKIHSPTFC